MGNLFSKNSTACQKTRLPVEIFTLVVKRIEKLSLNSASVPCKLPALQLTNRRVLYVYFLLTRFKLTAECIKLCFLESSILLLFCDKAWSVLRTRPFAEFTALLASEIFLDSRTIDWKSTEGGFSELLFHKPIHPAEFSGWLSLKAICKKHTKQF